MHALTAIESWGAPNAAAAVVPGAGSATTHGDIDRVFRLASVTKLITAYAVLIAIEDGVVSLDDAAGPPGATVRHLLAHVSGLPFEGGVPISRPAATRIYSNPGFDALGAYLAERAGVAFERWVTDRVIKPLGMTATRPEGRPSAGMHAPLRDLARFATELLRPTLVPAARLATATDVAFPGLAGVLPGLGRFEPLDWGLGFELRDGKVPHWTGQHNSSRTFGHFGGSGTFLWVDPVADLALVVLTDREFGPWALDAWPAISDAVLASDRGIRPRRG
jgi:CubicO group peptidase (beta-lactamase class C family)